ncbi:MAG TPA: hypothetical protein VEZ20_10795 [Allosphingosinicella sp.]|nr:hypothetical protein [Allosphingosinicella sp.]
MALTEGYDVIDQGGRELVPGITFDYIGNAFSSQGGYIKYASVGFMEQPNQRLLYQDGSASIALKGDIKSFFWNSAAPLNVSTATFSYAGHGGFANIFAGSGNDVLYGGSESNILYGGAGVDQLFGDAGNDVLMADAADLAYGIVSGGDGFDTLVLEGSVSGLVYAADYQVESIVGTDSHDYLVGAGSTEGVFLYGMAGNDQLFGSARGNPHPCNSRVAERAGKAEPPSLAPIP